MSNLRLRVPASHRHQRGVGLVEVLVAVVVLAFGLLGIAAMQLTSLKNSQGALARSQAIAQTYAMLDAMRANRNIAIIGGYNVNNVCLAANGTSLAANDLAHWITTMQSPTILGPTACGTINCGAATCTISVSWDDVRSVNGNANEKTQTADRVTVTTVTLL
ncbi:Type IV fimbrial biogenesis protein PilV [Lysobacter dokdonensis DS-58]|uniref:Type IV fimbrial biogenesis protein PilV n=1 Tax=Lysobacter dokdonensis DS-58 TaxID=1300345 RepID=A0A0A2X5F0_9GAMM|nr:type IV pilus modification protein PilV [Lysobacter dokdonensis]KGQ20484.1 Type IV fimbrial biogenesis protein PilV [Lysobacter dokdonensis DS-58]